MRSPAAAMSGSGAHNPAAPLPASHEARSGACEAGSSDAATQCAPPHAGAHSGSDDGSISGGPAYGHSRQDPATHMSWSPQVAPFASVQVPILTVGWQL